MTIVIRIFFQFFWYIHALIRIVWATWPPSIGLGFRPSSMEGNSEPHAPSNTLSNINFSG